MGKQIQLKIKKIAQSTSGLFDIIFFGESANQIQLVFPEQPKLPKNLEQAFNRDMKNVSMDFKKSIKFINE